VTFIKSIVCKLFDIIKNLNCDIPIYAIGGIRLEDAEKLAQTSVYGIALSSLILENKEPENLIKELRNYFKEIKN
jgi:thiamine-phosphate pyrophosphorylase